MWSNGLEMHRLEYKSIVVFFFLLWSKTKRKNIERTVSQKVICIFQTRLVLPGVGGAEVYQ